MSMPYFTSEKTNTGTNVQLTNTYDPILDERCSIISSENNEKWSGAWIWYPGQRTAHLHALNVKKAVERCQSIGYPGYYRQPQYCVYFRKKGVLDTPATIKVMRPGCTIHVKVNNKEINPLITAKSINLPAGEIVLTVYIDFCTGLPCMIMDGPIFSTGPSWEASLDNKKWVPSECDPWFSSPQDKPGDQRHTQVHIPPRNIVSASGVKTDGTQYHFEKDSEVIIDFGHIELGSLNFDISGQGRVSALVGQSIPEAQNADIRFFEQRAIPDIQVEPRIRQIVSPECCLRYVTLKSSDKCTVDNLIFNANVSPLQYNGSFSCNDPLLNDIWAMAAATLHSTMHDFYLDGIMRDATPWALDGIGAMEAAECVFADPVTSRNMIISQTLPDNPSLDDLTIADYTIYTILGFYTDYLVRGDEDFLIRYKDRIYDIVNLYHANLDEHGFFNAMKRGDPVGFTGFLPDWNVTNKTGPDTSGTPAYVQILLMRTFEIVAEWALKWNDNAIASRYNATAEKLRLNITKHFWDDKEQVFQNGYLRNGEKDLRLSSFAQVFGILYNLIPKSSYDSVVKKVLLNPDHRKGNFSMNAMWEVQALAQAGRADVIVDQLQKIWGEIVNRGEVRFPEDIIPGADEKTACEFYGRPFGMSLCHAWSGAVPLIACARGLLGINPTGPAYSTCTIRPQLGSMLWIKGHVPTVHGPICLEYSKDGGTLTLPDKVTAQLHGIATTDGARTVQGPGTFSVAALSNT